MRAQRWRALLCLGIVVLTLGALVVGLKRWYAEQARKDEQTRREVEGLLDEARELMWQAGTGSGQLRQLGNSGLYIDRQGHLIDGPQPFPSPKPPKGGAR